MSTEKPGGKRENGAERKRIVRKKPDDSTSSFDNRGRTDKPKRPYGTRPETGNGDNDKPKRPYGTRSESSYNDKKPKRPYGTRTEGSSTGNERPKRDFNKRPDRDDKPKRSFEKREERSERPKRDFDKRGGGREEKTKRSFDTPAKKKAAIEHAKRAGGGSPDTFFAKTERPQKPKWEIEERTPKRAENKSRDRVKKQEEKDMPVEVTRKDEVMPLNKYVAHCGICSRREAADLIKEGKVKVNGEVMTEPGYKVQLDDKVEYDDKVIMSQKNLVYILLNKPKNYLTTTDDPQERKTVMELVADAGDVRVYPVGRLDRNTSGLLLLTNDGELAQKLSHPKYNIKKVYQVTLDKALTKAHFDKIIAGLTLEDGEIKVDDLAYLEKKNEIGIEIHSGRNRIVRRIFEHLGYTVDKLDRVVYAGLTKKNIPRGKWRFLSKQEIINMKYIK